MKFDPNEWDIKFEVSAGGSMGPNLATKAVNRLTKEVRWVGHLYVDSDLPDVDLFLERVVERDAARPL